MNNLIAYSVWVGRRAALWWQPDRDKAMAVLTAMRMGGIEHANLYAADDELQPVRTLVQAEKVWHYSVLGGTGQWLAVRPPKCPTGPLDLAAMTREELIAVISACRCGDNICARCKALQPFLDPIVKFSVCPPMRVMTMAQRLAALKLAHGLPPDLDLPSEDAATVNDVRRMAASLRVSPAWLAFGDEPPRPYTLLDLAVASAPSLAAAAAAVRDLVRLEDDNTGKGLEDAGFDGHARSIIDMDPDPYTAVAKRVAWRLGIQF